MYAWIKQRVVDFLRVPPEPADPAGREESLRVFRAAPGFFKYRRLVWLIGSVIGGVIELAVFLGALFGGLALLENSTIGGTVVLLIALFTLVFAVFMMAFSYITMRLDYEFRWYKVTDRSLRIREGVWFVREMTMSFANIQNISISQGPLQRIFGISDLQVETAGGGGKFVGQQQPGQSQVFNMHVGFFRGVDNAEEIRDLMLTRLRRLKDSGLGDIEEAAELAPEVVPGTAPAAPPLPLKALLQSMAAEARAMREAAASMDRGR